MILIALSLLLTIPMVHAQIKTTPSYSEKYEKGSGKLRAKEWVTKDKMRIESFDAKGNRTIMIYRADSAKIYTYVEVDKRWTVFPMSKLQDGTFLGGGMNLTGTSTKRKRLREEEAEGFDCTVYYVESKTGHENGMTSNADKTEWIYEPYQMVIKESDMINPGGYLVRRNIKIGEPDPSVFELEGYKGGSDLPMGGLMELMMNFTKDSKTNEKSGGNKSSGNNKSDADKMVEMMKQLMK